VARTGMSHWDRTRSRDAVHVEQVQQLATTSHPSMTLGEISSGSLVPSDGDCAMLDEDASLGRLRVAQNLIHRRRMWS